jgi:hypothetical protein
VRIRSLLLAASAVAVVIALVVLALRAAPTRHVRSTVARADEPAPPPEREQPRRVARQPRRPLTPAVPAEEAPVDETAAIPEAAMAGAGEERVVSRADVTGLRKRPPLNERFPGMLGSAGDGPAEDPDQRDRAAQASRFYDRGDYESAQKTALEVLAQQPNNIRMLRIVVSTACALGDPDLARSYNAKLPGSHQRSMQTRCTKFGVTL